VNFTQNTFLKFLNIKLLIVFFLFYTPHAIPFEGEPQDSLDFVEITYRKPSKILPIHIPEVVKLWQVTCDDFTQLEVIKNTICSAYQKNSHFPTFTIIQSKDEMEFSEFEAEHFESSTQISTESFSKLPHLCYVEVINQFFYSQAVDSKPFLKQLHKINDYHNRAQKTCDTNSRK